MSGCDEGSSGNIAVKLSTGEPGSDDLRPKLIGDLAQSLGNPTIVECNTAIADVDIMDENGSMTLPVTGGSNLTENEVGANFANYDYFIVLSHFKEHAIGRVRRRLGRFFGEHGRGGKVRSG